MIESIIMSLILTVFTETLLAVLIGLKNEKEIGNVILINCLTNPSLVITTNWSYIISQSIIIRNIVLIILEIVVVFIEGAFFKKFLNELKINPYLLALYLNGLSFIIGLIISQV